MLDFQITTYLQSVNEQAMNSLGHTALKYHSAIHLCAGDSVWKVCGETAGFKGTDVLITIVLPVSAGLSVA